MYFVIGNSPKRVELKDLNDCVYYKQQKVFSDSQYQSSVDLKRAIERKSLIVLKKSEDSTGSFDADTVIVSSDIKSPEPESSPQVDLLLNKIRDLEKRLENQPPSTPASHNNDALAIILDRLERLEKSPAAIDTSAMTSIQEALKGIETKMQDNKSDGLLEKLEGIISRSGGSSTPVQEENRRVEDIYVPNIRVEDANSHIKLEVRTIDTGDSVSDSLKKLKELKSKSK
jgi:hypothetical protein